MQQIGSEIAAQSKVKGHFCPHHLCPVAFLFCMSVCVCVSALLGTEVLGLSLRKWTAALVGRLVGQCSRRSF